MLLRVDDVEQLQYIRMLHFFQHQDFSYYRFFPGLLYKLEFFINFYCDNHTCSFMKSLFNICVGTSTKMVCNLVITNHCIIASLVIAGLSLFFLVHNCGKHLFVQALNFKVMFLLRNWLANSDGILFFPLSQPVLFY